LFNLATRRAQEERLREEIDGHIALQTEEDLRAGVSPVEARRQAMLKFGGVEAIKQDCRAERGLVFVENLAGDCCAPVSSIRTRRAAGSRAVSWTIGSKPNANSNANAGCFGVGKRAAFEGHHIGEQESGYPTHLAL